MMNEEKVKEVWHKAYENLVDDMKGLTREQLASGFFELGWRAADENQPKGTSIIKWQTGEPKEKGSHLVTLLNGNVRLTEFFKYQVAGREFWDSVPCKMENITAWCKLSDVEPYKE